MCGSVMLIRKIARAARACPVPLARCMCWKHLTGPLSGGALDPCLYPRSRFNGTLLIPVLLMHSPSVCMRSPSHFYAWPKRLNPAAEPCNSLHSPRSGHLKPIPKPFPSPSSGHFSSTQTHRCRRSNTHRTTVSLSPYCPSIRMEATPSDSQALTAAHGNMLMCVAHVSHAQAASDSTR